MKKVTLDSALRLLDQTLNWHDMRLSGHSELVAYITYKLALELGVSDLNELKVLCKTAFFHDIGYYTTILDHTFSADISVKDLHAHSAYGATFLNFMGDEDINLEIIMWHHTPWHIQLKNPNIVPEYACLLFLADAIAMALAYKDYETGLKVIAEIEQGANILYSPAHIKALQKVNKDNYLIRQICTGVYKTEIRMFFAQFLLTQKQSQNFAKKLIFLLQFHTPETFQHSMQVKLIAKNIASYYHVSDDMRKKIGQAAYLHDIGKLAIPTSILEKPTKLTDAEFNSMKYHTVAGYEILSVLGLDELRDIGIFHHENCIGTGYPFALKEKQLSFAAKLIAVADMAEALLAERSYKKALSKEKVISILEDNAKKGKLDVEIVNKFCENFDQIFIDARKKFKEEEQNIKAIHEAFESCLEEILEVNENAK